MAKLLKVLFDKSRLINLWPLAKKIYFSISYTILSSKGFYERIKEKFLENVLIWFKKLPNLY